MREFEGQWAIILGGSSGLGLASAKKLASHGMNLCLVHRDRKNALPAFEREVTRMKSHGVEVKTFNSNALDDSVSSDIIENLPKKSVRLLLHSIAKGSLKPMRGTSKEKLSIDDLKITTHAMGLSWYQWASQVIEKDVFAENARSIAFTSEGNNKVWKGYGAVSAAKSVLESLMRQMAVEWATLGIRTNCIQAGTTETPSFKAIPGSDTLAGMGLKRNPFKRLTQPEDVANVVYLLCKMEADWINGTIVKADGGENLR